MTPAWPSRTSRRASGARRMRSPHAGGRRASGRASRQAVVGPRRPAAAGGRCRRRTGRGCRGAPASGRPIRSGTSSVVDGRRARRRATRGRGRRDRLGLDGRRGHPHPRRSARPLSRRGAPGAQALGLWTQGKTNCWPAPTQPGRARPATRAERRGGRPSACAYWGCELEASARRITQRAHGASPPARGRSSRESSIPAARATSSL